MVSVVSVNLTTALAQELSTQKISLSGSQVLATTPQILRYALHTSKLGSFDPDFAKGSQDRTYSDIVFNSLLRYTPGDSRQIEPDLAIEIPKFVIRHNKQIWTIYLRKGVFFHESPYSPTHELTAHDVIFSLKKAGNLKFSSHAGGYKGMAFEIEDTHTLKIIFEKPISPLFFFPRIANWKGGFILSKQVIERHGYKKFLTHPVGTGPFKFVQYRAKKKLVLKANDRYFRGRPLLDGVEVYFMPDNKIREAAYKTGKLDAIYGVGTPGWVEKMEGEPNTRVDIFGPGFTGLFHFNTSIKPLDDIRVRQALSGAMDRDEFMAATSARLVSPVLSPMASGFLPGGLDNARVEALGLKSETNLIEARKILAAAGLGEGFVLDIPVSEKRLYKKNYGVLKSQLARIGVQINMTTMPHSQYHTMIRQNLSPIVLYFTFRPNADSYLRGFFHSNSIVKTGAIPNTNFSHSTRIDDLLDDALVTIDPKEQTLLWEHAQIRLLHDTMVFPLFVANHCVVSRSYVDYGHPLISSFAGYPQFNEKTRLVDPAK